MSSICVDTDCLIARICPEHSLHERAVRILDELVGEGIQLTLSGHSLAEAYAVLTRLPMPYRLAPEQAFELLERNITLFEIVSLEPFEIQQTLRNISTNGHGGGLTYDALILAAAQKSGAKKIVTFNKRDFAKLADESIEILVPA